MSISQCCLESFQWDGDAVGYEGKLATNNTYITGNSTNAAVMIVHDLLGWTYPNVRLLADHYAREANVTVYVPDFFSGEVLSFEAIDNGRWQEVDIAGFMQRNSREIREPEIFECAKALRLKYPKIGAVGFCYGGWAAFRLGAKEHQPALVDCISVGHPSLLTKKDIDEMAIPVQILAPELDPVYTTELKMHSFETLMNLGVPFDYQHFPGVEHACLVRGNDKKTGEREAMARGKNSVVGWLNQFLS